MDREVVKGLELGTTLLLVATMLSLGTLIFWYARASADNSYEGAVIQNMETQSAELRGLEMAGITDMPLASIYSILTKEWRATSEVAMYDTKDKLITVARREENWILSEPLTNSDGKVVLTEMTGPERVLYAVEGGYYSNTLSGRAYVTVKLDEVTLTYKIEVKLQQ